MNPPTIFVDLIEVQPLDFDDWSAKYAKDTGYAKRADAYSRYLARFQPWRWVALNADNEKKMARSPDRYFNRQDCLDAITELFGGGTTVFKREAEMGNVLLRRAVEQ